MPSSKTIPLFIMAGQSNMRGFDNGDLPEIKGLSLYESGMPGIEDLTGPQYAFAHALNLAGINEMAIVRTALGGKSIRPIDGIDWSPQSDGELYDSLMTNIKTAILDLTSKGFDVEIKGLFWMQGEADATRVANAQRYEADLTAFIKQIRADLHMPDLPVHLGAIGDDDTRFPEGGAIVRETQQHLAETLHNVSYVETKTFEMDDWVHFSESGYYELGEGFANSFLEKTSSIFTHGTDGKDVINGTSAQDHILGELADDIINGGDGSDYLFGQEGNDRLYGGKGNDLLYGGNGNDMISGNEGKDYLNGGFGNDRLDGGAGDDYLFGGNGDDVLRGGAGADVLNGFTGNDLVSYAASDAAVTVSLLRGAVNHGGHAEGDTIMGVENLIGSAFDDNLRGNGRDNTINGGAGNDTIYGDHGNDRLIGDAGNDVLRGGNGNDILRGGAGADTLRGDEGIDTASYEKSDGGVKVSLATGIGHGHDAEGDRLSGIERLAGSDFADRLEGDANDNALMGRDGDDILNGGAGNDRLSGEADNDTINAGTGDDILLGGDGNDILRGDAGNDTLHGGAGADNLRGGDGDDIFIFRVEDFANGFTTDTIRDFHAGDSIKLFGFTGDDVSAVSNGTVTTLTLHNADHQVVGSINLEATQPSDIEAILSKIDYA